jgi:uncharacterized DUF497 family protein
MKLSYDPLKRKTTLEERQLDFDSAGEVFSGLTYDRVDDRTDYGETRIVTAGYLRERMVVIVWTQRGDARHIISMRKANEREQNRYKAWLD